MKTFFLDEYKVRKLMIQNNLSMLQICRNCKLGKNTLYRAFNGSPVHKRTLFKLATELNVKIDELIKNNGENKYEK